MSASRTQPFPRRRPLSFQLVDRDRYPALAWLALAGLALAAAMAVVGLPPLDLHGPLHYRRIMDPLCGV